MFFVKRNLRKNLFSIIFLFLISLRDVRLKLHALSSRDPIWFSIFRAFVKRILEERFELDINRTFVR